MHLFSDPSVLPVTTTDLEGNILKIRTNGLHYYGLPDIVVDQNFENGEQLILDILDRVFKLTFDINMVWSYDGKLFEFEILDGLAYIRPVKMDVVRIISINCPITGEAHKHRSEGLKSLYSHPELEVGEEILFGRDILRYVIDQVKKGVIYDQDSVVTYLEHIYNFHQVIDRFGNHKYQIIKEEAAIPADGFTTKKKKRVKHLRLVK